VFSKGIRFLSLVTRFVTDNKIKLQKEFALVYLSAY
jgi:hypothetical protein